MMKALTTEVNMEEAPTLPHEGAPAKSSKSQGNPGDFLLPKGDFLPPKGTEPQLGFSKHHINDSEA